MHLRYSRTLDQKPTFTSADQPGSSKDRPPKGHVSCPVCSTFVPEGAINGHLDECLNGGGLSELDHEPEVLTQAPASFATQLTSKPSPFVRSTSQLVSPSQPSAPSSSSRPQVKKNTMKPVTKVVYTLLKDNQLRDLLKKEGLDTKGDKKALINRHKKFSVLWNAQCDEEVPMSR